MHVTMYLSICRESKIQLLDFRPLAKALRLSTIKLGILGGMTALVVSSVIQNLTGEFSQTCRAEVGRRNKFRHPNARRIM